MDCNKIQEKLSAYFEGIIPSEEKLLFDEHLKSCEKCRESLADLQKTIEYLKTLEEIEPPEWLTQQVMSRIKTEVKPKKGILQRLFYPLHIKVPIQAAATILIAISTIYIFKTVQPVIKSETHTEITQAPLKEPLQPLIEEKDKITAFEESKTAAGKPDKQPMPAKELGTLRDKSIAAPKSSALSEQPELLKRQKTPAPFGRQVGEMSSAAGYGAEHETRQKALPTAPMAKALSLKKKEGISLEEGISLTVNVKDFEADSREIEKAVIQAGGKIIKTESLKNKDIIFAELSSERFKELIEKLKLIGEVKEKAAFYDLKGYIRIRIEIVKMSIKE